MELDSSFYERFAAICREAAEEVVELGKRQDGGSSDQAAALQRLFRITHDLAGQAGMLSLPRVSGVARRAADRLRRRRELSDEGWPLVTNCIERLLESAARTATGKDAQGTLASLDEELAAHLPD